MLENFTIFDAISILLILVLGIKGILRGFIKEFFGLVGVIGGIFVASRYANQIGTLLSENLFKLQNETTLYLVGFIVTFVLFWIITALIGSALSKIANSSGLGLINKIFGFIVGGAKIFLIFSIIIFVLSNIVIIKKNIETFFKDSFMYPIFYEVGSKIVKLDETNKSLGKIDTKHTDTTNRVKESTQDVIDSDEEYKKFFE